MADGLHRRRTAGRGSAAMVGVTLWLAGCTGGGVVEGLADGARLELHRALTVPIGWARVAIQDGEAIDPRQIYAYRPYCQIEIRDLSTDVRPLTIEPDSFRVSGWYYDYRGVDRARTLAAGLDTRLGVIFDDAGRGMWTISTEMRLSSARQPGVQRLMCGFWGDRSDRHLGVGAIRRVLGNLASLHAPGA